MLVVYKDNKKLNLFFLYCYTNLNEIFPNWLLKKNKFLLNSFV